MTNAYVIVCNEPEVGAYVLDESSSNLDFIMTKMRMRADEFTDELIEAAEEDGLDPPNDMQIFVSPDKMKIDVKSGYTSLLSMSIQAITVI